MILTEIIPVVIRVIIVNFGINIAIAISTAAIHMAILIINSIRGVRERVRVAEWQRKLIKRVWIIVTGGGGGVSIGLSGCSEERRSPQIRLCRARSRRR